MKYFLVITLVFLTSFSRQGAQNETDNYYLKDKGVYIKFSKGTVKKKFPFMEKWDFYFSIKNDTTAIVQDVRDNAIQPAIEYKISSRLDTVYIKRSLGDKIKVEKMTFKLVSN